MSRIRVVTWNVHGFVGTDGVLDVDRVAGVLRELDADIVGLQEVDRRATLADGTDRLERVCTLTGHHATFGPTARLPLGRFGNALLTRRPVTNVEHFDVSMGSWEPRGILSADLSVGDALLRVIVTHFGLRVAERRAQLEKLLDLVGTTSDGPVLLVGDFNEWRPKAYVLSRLHAALGRAPRVLSYPSRFPLLALDRVWVRPETALVELSTYRKGSARVASDHLPVAAVVDLALLPQTLPRADHDRRG